MKRLLCILSGMNVGGAETFLMKVYRTIDRTEYQMDFCINEKEKCFYEEEIVNMGGRIFRIPSKSQDLKEFKRQLSAIVKNNSYYYVLRISSNAMGFMDLKIAKNAGAKVCCARSSNSSDGAGFRAKFAHQVGKILYGKYVDVKIAPSDLAAKYTFGRNAYESGSVRILHNGLDLDLYRYSEEKRRAIRKEFSISEGTKLIGHIGRFDEQKNHMFLLEVFRKIHLLESDTKLLLVGEGKLKEAVQRKVNELGISDSVVFCQVRSDVPFLLSAMDVFVMPSFYEGMPNTVIEAQATGLPCVISDTITREANITGLVSYVPLDAPNVWSDAVLTAIKKERLDTKQAFVEQGYDIKSVGKDFVHIVFK